MLYDEETPVQYFSEASRVILICKILGLMCTGQYTEMQDLLHKQKESIQSINMIEELTHFLDIVIEKKSFTFEMLKLYIKIMETITEACVGNVNNSKTILDGNIIPVINTFLQIYITKINIQQQSQVAVTDFSDERTSRINFNQTGQRSQTDNVTLRKYGLLLKVAAVEILEVMAEKTSSQKEDITHQIYEGLDINALHWSMVDFFTLRHDHDIVSMQLEDNAERALFSAYNVCMYIADTKVCSKEKFG